MYCVSGPFNLSRRLTCHLDVSRRLATSTRHVDLSRRLVTSTCHLDLSRRLVTSTCHVDLSRRLVTSTCHLDLPRRLVTAAEAEIHCVYVSFDLSRRLVTSTCHVDLAPRLITSTCHLDLPRWLVTSIFIFSFLGEWHASTSLAPRRRWKTMFKNRSLSTNQIRHPGYVESYFVLTIIWSI